MLAVNTIGNSLFVAFEEVRAWNFRRTHPIEEPETPSNDPMYACPHCGYDTRFSQEWYNEHPEWLHTGGGPGSTGYQHRESLIVKA